MTALTFGRGCLVVAVLVANPAAAETAVRFSLESRIEGPAAPLLIAIDKGFLKADGLNVTVDAAASPTEAIARVGSGAYDMGIADFNTLIRARDTNPAAAAVKAVFIVYNRAPYAITARKSRGIAQPRDLEGKKLGAPAAEGATNLWPVFAKANEIDIAKVAVENVGFPVREPMLAAGQVDAVTGLSFGPAIDLKDRGVPADDIVVLPMTSNNAELYGNAIVVNTKFAAEHPDAVRNLLRAYVKGLRETIRSPAAAVDSVIKRNDTARKPAELERLQAALRDAIATPEAKANGYGGLLSARFDRTVELIGTAYKFKTVPKADDVFDAAFLPPEAERKF